MICKLPQQLNKEEVLRYLGAKGQAVPASIEQLVQRAEKELWSIAKPHGATRRMTVEQLQPLLEGKDIAAHLKGCQECILMGVTAGPAVDGALRRAFAMDMAYGVVLDAAASTLVEQVADALEQQLRAEVTQQQKFMTGRFSPGYGDWPIFVQPRFVQWMDGTRQAGICVTSTCLLTPSKTITALCGVADHPVKGKLAGCANCALRETCTKRKEGNPCAAEVV